MKRRGSTLHSTHRTPRVLAEVLPGPAAFCVLSARLRQLEQEGEMIGLMVLLALAIYLAISIGVVQWTILMVSLVVPALLEELNPAIGFNGAVALLRATANNAGKGEELILDALSGLLLGERIQPSYGGAFA